MTFIQKVILELKDDVSTPARVVKLLFNINSHMSKWVPFKKQEILADQILADDTIILMCWC